MLKGKNLKMLPQDSKKDFWLFRILPNSFHPYILLCRLDRPIGIWLLFWPCSWGIQLGHQQQNQETLNIELLLLFALGALIMRSAGCIYNDIIDRKVDSKVERTKYRPLANNQISVRRAIILMIVLLFFASIVILQLNTLSIIIGSTSILLVVIYPLMKKYTYWPQLFLGLTFNWGIIVGYAASSNNLSTAMIALYISGIFWTLGYDTIYAFQDVKYDKAAGIKSLTIVIQKKPKLFLMFFYILSIIFLTLCGILANMNYFFYILDFIGLTYLLTQIKNVNLTSPSSCLLAFKSNAIYGLIVFVSIFLGIAV